jgi:hypothetical protein
MSTAYAMFASKSFYDLRLRTYSGMPPYKLNAKSTYVVIYHHWADSPLACSDVFVW